MEVAVADANRAGSLVAVDVDLGLLKATTDRVDLEDAEPVALAEPSLVVDGFEDADAAGVTVVDDVHEEGGLGLLRASEQCSSSLSLLGVLPGSEGRERYVLWVYAMISKQIYIITK